MIIMILQLATPLVLWLIDKMIFGAERKIKAKKQFIEYVESRKASARGPLEARESERKQDQALEDWLVKKDEPKSEDVGNG
jgi:hypothetical protein